MIKLVDITLPATFKNIRKSKGIPSTFVARKLNMTRQSLQNKEDGKTDFTFQQGVAYCKLLGVKIEDILL